MTNNSSYFSVGGSVGGSINNNQGSDNQTIMGDGNVAFQGSNNHVNVNQGTSLTSDDIVKLLEELKTLVHDTELSGATQEKVSSGIDEIKKATNAKEPKKETALVKLETVAQTLEKTNETVDASQKLWINAKPIIKTIAKWLGAAVSSYLLRL